MHNLTDEQLGAIEHMATEYRNKLISESIRLSKSGGIDCSSYENPKMLALVLIRASVKDLAKGKLLVEKYNRDVENLLHF